MKVIFLGTSRQEGCRIRILNYFPYLKREKISSKFYPLYSEYLYNIKNKKGLLYLIQKIVFLIYCLLRRIFVILFVIPFSEVVFLNREIFPFFTPFFERFAQKIKRKFIFDFDDAIFTYPTHIKNWRDILRNPENVSKIIPGSSAVIVGNKFLYDYAKKYKNKKIYIIPSVIDFEQYKMKNNYETREIVIGWIGSFSTLGSLYLLKNVFNSLSQKYKCKLKIIGGINIFDFFIEGIKIERVSYTEKNEVAELQTFDIGVMPLPDTLWERGKCGFKALQYMAVGVPCVSSPIGVNTEIIKDGINGFLAEKEEEWIQKLSMLIEDKELRKKMGLEGRKTVEEKYSINVWAPKLIKIIKSVYYINKLLRPKGQSF